MAIDYLNMNKAEKLTGAVLIQSLLGSLNPAVQKQTATKMKIAGVIADRLQDCKLSKAQLAKKMNRDPSVITKWLCGTHNFTIDTLTDIGTCLDIPTSEFFKEQEEPVVSSIHFAIKSNHLTSLLPKSSPTAI